ncbi:non-heme iron oxygenase ferredoxin subunit [Phenylobacterium sp. LjRoot219]|uniref:Rieske (2Fe-2S) protein n=1 Tax=Phenylobacterium sp. LjRoot219 TaxID=3342283 RepID=UPI003ECE7C63
MSETAAYVRVAQVSDLQNNRSLAVEVDGVGVLLCSSRDQLFAVASICSHAHESLAGGRIKHGVLCCPVHGARFDLATGAALNPPAVEPIATYPTRVVDGWIEVAVS